MEGVGADAAQPFSGYYEPNPIIGITNPIIGLDNRILEYGVLLRYFAYFGISGAIFEIRATK